MCNQLILDPVKQSVERATDAMLETIGDKDAFYKRFKI